MNYILFYKTGNRILFAQEGNKIELLQQQIAAATAKGDTITASMLLRLLDALQPTTTVQTAPQNTSGTESSIVLLAPDMNGTLTNFNSQEALDNIYENEFDKIDEYLLSGKISQESYDSLIARQKQEETEVDTELLLKQLPRLPVLPELSTKQRFENWLGRDTGTIFGTNEQATEFGIRAGGAVLDAADNALMGDKNFGAQSALIDMAANAVTEGALQVAKTAKNPFVKAGALAVAGSTKFLNFATKAVGTTTLGYDVDINSSGYSSNLGHQDSKSRRDFGALVGLGGISDIFDSGRHLKERNEKAAMALRAANIADTLSFELEARANSVDDVLQLNLIALQGGIDTSLLAARHGARLELIAQLRKRIKPDPEHVIIHEKVIIHSPSEETVVKAQNGAKLEHIDISKEQSVIPSGALHKNKNNIDLNITEKGIPVITVEDDSAETFEEIKEQEDTLVQHAEVEAAEIIFNKELTLYIENLRKQWHEKDEKDDLICLEAGMRLAKEILENTEDNTDVTEKSIEAVENERN